MKHTTQSFARTSLNLAVQEKNRALYLVFGQARDDGAGISDSAVPRINRECAAGTRTLHSLAVRHRSFRAKMQRHHAPMPRRGVSRDVEICLDEINGGAVP